MIKYLLLFVGVLFIQVTWGQVSVIAFKDSARQTPLPGVLCELLELDRSDVQIKGIADGQGYCPIGRTFGAKYVEASCIGYVSKKLPLKGNTLSGDTLVVYLSSNEIALSEVSIVAVRKLVREDAKGSRLDLSSLKEAAFWPMKKALEQLPGILVDEQNGAITYMGRAVAIQEDGMSPGFQLKDLLSAPAGQYKAIELTLYDPKNKFDGPILNLVRPPREMPLWGRAVAQANLDGQEVSALLGIHHKIHTIELYPSYGYTKMPGKNSSGTLYIPQTEYESISLVSSDTPARNSWVFGGRYHLDLKKHQLDLTASYRRPTAMEYVSSSSQKEYYSDTLFRSYNRVYARNSLPNFLSAVLGYQYTINSRDKLYVTLDMSNSTTDMDESSLISVDKGPFPLLTSYQKQKTEHAPDLFSSISYEHRDKKWGVMESGAKYFYRKQDYELTYTEIFPDERFGIPEMANYLNSYHYVALFASWSHTLHQYNFNLVLKGDYSFDQIKIPEKNRFEFFTIAPYLSVYRNFNGHSLRCVLQYNERRPPLAMLNPITEPGAQSGQFIRKGNPDLNPSKAYSTLLSYSAMFVKKLDVSTSLGYIYTRDEITSYSKLVDSTSTIMEVTNINLGFRQNANFNLQLTCRITPELRGVGVINSSWNRVDDGKAIQTYQSSLCRLDMDYTKGQWQFGMYGRYSKIENYQYASTGEWTYGLSAGFIHKEWNIQANVSTPCPYYRISNSTINADGYYSYSQSKFRQFNASVIITYSFGKGKSNVGAKAVKKDDM